MRPRGCGGRPRISETCERGFAASDRDYRGARWLRRLARGVPNYSGQRSLGDLRGVRDSGETQFGPGIKERMEFAATVTADQATAAQRTAHLARTHIRALVPEGTIIVLPTAPSIAPRLDQKEDELESFRVRVMRLTCMAGLAGLPQITLPVGTVSGCPVGLSLIGWPGSDEVLLGLAVSLARYCGIART